MREKKTSPLVVRRAMTLSREGTAFHHRLLAPFYSLGLFYPSGEGQNGCGASRTPSPTDLNCTALERRRVLTGETALYPPRAASQHSTHRAGRLGERRTDDGVDGIAMVGCPGGRLEEYKQIKRWGKSRCQSASI